MLLEPSMKQTDMLKITKLHHAMVEVTTSCNLRCSYCLVSSPLWQPGTLPANVVMSVLNELKNLNTTVIHLHGHGETTIVEGWTDYAKTLLDANIHVSLCSNLSKQLSDYEIDILSRFSHLAVSLDTLNPEMFKKLRRGGDIKHVLYNMIRIMTVASKHQRPLRISWSIVASDQNVWGLLDLAHCGIMLGVKGLTFCNLGVNETPKNAIEVNHIAELPADDCRKALAMFDKIKTACLMANVTCDLKYGIIDSLMEKINKSTESKALPLKLL